MATSASSYEHGYEDSRFEHAVSQNFHCPICLNVFKEPMMCRRNQHFFCRSCITRHLHNSPTCPTCKEELTPETLSKASRLLTNCLDELNIRCDYYKRGCREIVQLGDLETHVKNCGFSPVMCSNQGCLMEINSRDKTHHETEICEFRKVKCHDCTEVKRELDEVKANLNAVHDNLRDIKDDLKSLTEIKDQLHKKPDHDDIVCIVGAAQKKRRKVEGNIGKKNIKPGVIIAGRDGQGYLLLNSVEILDWSTKSWSSLQPMKVSRCGASSFVYKNQMILAGGWTGLTLTDKMEAININPVVASTQWFDFPAKLPSKLYQHKSLVHNEHLITIGGNDGNVSDRIHEVSLVPPYTSKMISRMPEPRWCQSINLFNGKILIIGGMAADSSESCTNSVFSYDINKKKCKQMSPLPYVVYGMATVSWGDNVVVIGGADKDGKVLNTVIIYNVKTEESHMLPAMKYKRIGCVAVVVDNTIVVMGGMDEELNSVESFSFDRYSWEDLPPMNEARCWATAVAW